MLRALVAVRPGVARREGAHFLRGVARPWRKERARHVSGRIDPGGVSPATSGPGTSTPETPTQAQSHTARVCSLRPRRLTAVHGRPVGHGIHSPARRWSTETRPSGAAPQWSAAHRDADGCGGGTFAIRGRLVSIAFAAVGARMPSAPSEIVSKERRVRSRRAGRTATIAFSVESPYRGEDRSDATADRPCESRGAVVGAADRRGRSTASASAAAPRPPRATPRVGSDRGPNRAVRCVPLAAPRWR